MFPKGERDDLDRIDKVLLVLPILPFMDLLSTLYSLSFGGEEVGILARPILANYGPYGLFALAISGSIIFLVCMQVLMRVKGLFVKELRFRWMWHVLTLPIYWLFFLEGFYVSTIIVNVLIPLAPLVADVVFFKVALIFIYFACVSGLTISQMRKLPRF